MKETLAQAKERYRIAQEQMCRAANKTRRDVEYAEGDEVLISFKHLNLGVYDQYLQSFNDGTVVYSRLSGRYLM